MNRWDVYWADVPFEEDALQGKRRPVVIASDRTVYVLRVTSTRRVWTTLMTTHCRSGALPV